MTHILLNVNVHYKKFAFFKVVIVTSLPYIPTLFYNDLFSTDSNIQDSKNL